jgi:hypothetical protein
VRVHEPGIAETGRPPHRFVAVRGKPDRRRTLRHERKAGFCQGKTVLLRGHGLSAKQSADHAELVLEELGALPRGHLRKAESGVFDRPVAEAHAKHEVPAGDCRQGRSVLRDLHRVEQRQEHNRGADRHSRGGRGHTPQQRHALEHLKRLREEVLPSPNR